MFTVIKCLNYRLHVMFDTGEMHLASEKQKDKSGNGAELSTDRDLLSSKVEVSSHHGDGLGEVIELESLNRSSLSPVEGRSDDPNLEQVVFSCSLLSPSVTNQADQSSGDTIQVNLLSLKAAFQRISLIYLNI